MSKYGYIAAAIALSAAITFFLRALPFLAFRGEHGMPGWLERLGKLLPQAIMAVLIVYCLKDVRTDWVHTGIPELAGVITTAASYKWKHNTLVSILLGTVTCMLLIHIL